MKDIEALIRVFNEGWQQGRLEQVAPLLHEQVVFVSPDFQQKLTGKKKCLQTLETYGKEAVTHSFKITKQEIESWDRTAVAVFDYEVSYSLSGSRYRERGTEIWTLTKKENDWLLAWRAIVRNEELK